MPLLVANDSSTAGVPTCRADSARVAIDHVTLVVADLESAATAFRSELGFSLKPGTVHPDGLRNAHIRFVDGSAIELMNPGEGIPDALSELYVRFLAAGEGGAFVALRAGPVDSVLSVLGELGAGASVERGKAVDWIAFPEGHDLHSVYFVHVRSRPTDRSEHLVHANGTMGISRVWLQMRDPTRLARLLAPFGATWCDSTDGSAGGAGPALGLRGGSLYVLPMEADQPRARILGLSLRGEAPRPPAELHGVWIEWESGSW